MMWIVENTEGHPMLKGYDFACIELYSHGTENQLRKYVLDGSGTLWFPSVESKMTDAKPFGRLWAVVETACSAELRKRAMDFAGLDSKKIAFFPAN